MTEKEVCLMCENYLKRQLDESELKRSYMVNPSAIGYRNDMGW